MSRPRKTKLAAEVERWKRLHNQPDWMREKRAAESWKRADRRDRNRLGHEYVQYDVADPATLDSILWHCLCPEDYTDGDLSGNLETLAQQLTDGKIRLLRNEEIDGAYEKSAARVGAIIRDAQDGGSWAGGKALEAVEQRDRLHDQLTVWDSYLPPHKPRNLDPSGPMFKGMKKVVPPPKEPPDPGFPKVEAPRAAWRENVRPGQGNLRKK